MLLIIGSYRQPRICLHLFMSSFRIAQRAPEAARLFQILGTRYTMERRFLRDRLEARGLEVIVPGQPDRTTIHDIQFNELVLGKRLDSSRRAFIEVIGRLVDQGAEGVILGCTEFGMLIGAGDTSVPLFDTTVLHARRAVDLALTQ